MFATKKEVKTMSKIKLITDTGSDVTREMAEALDILVLPFGITFGEKEYNEYSEITFSEFYSMLRSSKEPPKTAQIPPQRYYEVFTECLKEYDTVIYVCLSSTMSNTYNNAVLARNMVLEEQPDADLVVIDSKQVTLGYGFPVVRTAEKIKAGASRDEAIAYLEHMLANIDIFFSFDTLVYIRAGGRISATKLMVGTLLDIKPILRVTDGILTQFDKVRGSKNVNAKLLQAAQDYLKENGEHCEIIFLHSDVADKIEGTRKLFAENGIVPDASKTAGSMFPNGCIGDIGPVIGTHGGPGILAVLLYKGNEA
jgi:DegV family protein with EDD domain